MKDSIIIGIAGGTGCGKSTLINKIKDEFNDEITILSHDFYYKQHNDIPFEERKKINYDHPNAFDTDIMIQHIKELAQGHIIERPVYDFTIHNRIDETVTVYPAKVIVVEGILIFENEEQNYRASFLIRSYQYEDGGEIIKNPTYLWEDFFGYNSIAGNGLTISWVDDPEVVIPTRKQGKRINLNDGKGKADEKPWRFIK